jgi:purine nucleoside phosphorylase
MLGLVGGTGLERPPGPRFSARRQETPYGAVEVHVGEVAAGRPAVFWSRHGTQHGLPPHRVPYRAGMWALRALGVRHVVATAAVGSLRPEWPPGRLVRVADVLDRTWGRPSTYFDGPPLPVVHLEAGALYCAELGRRLTAAARAAAVALEDGAVLAVTQGPRFETPAEIRALRILGADLVGMTGLPEAVLARELGMAYATLALVVNPAAGMAGPIDVAAIDRAAAAGRGDVLALVRRLEVPEEPCPDCAPPAGAPPFPWPLAPA